MPSCSDIDDMDSVYFDSNSSDSASNANCSNQNDETSEEEETECYSEDEDEEYEICGLNSPITVHPFLEADIIAANEFFSDLQPHTGGSDPVLSILHSLSQHPQYEIQITLPLKIINMQFREWWGLEENTIRITLSNVDPKKYRTGDVPEPLVRLPSAVHNLATDALQNFLKQYLDSLWKVKNEDAMNSFESQHFFFNALISVLIGRMKVLGNYCVQCGKEQLGAHPLLTVCDEELCRFQRDRLRQCLGGWFGPRLWQDSADLLVFLFLHANGSANTEREYLLEPNPEKYRLWDHKHDKDSLNKCLSKFCTRCVFSSWKSFKSFRDADNNKPSSDLLYWLSDRFPVVCRLPPRFRVTSLQTEHQYLLPPVPCEKEETFLAHKAAAGGKTFFAYHGSPVSRWYSILSRGLMVCSGTKMQRVGAVYGSGIYMGKSPNISAQYSCHGGSMSLNLEYCDSLEHKTRREHLSSGTWCLALCEVADDKTKYTTHHDNAYYVVTDPEIIQIRMLFVYDRRGTMPSTSIGDGEIKKLREAMDFFGHHHDYRERIAAVLDSNKDKNQLDDDADLIPVPIYG